MKAILKITVEKKINKDDQKFYEELLAEGSIISLYENFEPEYEGKHELIFEE